MKCEVIIDPAAEEKAVIYAREHNEQIEKLKKLIEETGTELVRFSA